MRYHNQRRARIVHVRNYEPCLVRRGYGKAAIQTDGEKRWRFFLKRLKIKSRDADRSRGKNFLTGTNLNIYDYVEYVHGREYHQTTYKHQGNTIQSWS